MELIRIGVMGLQEAKDLQKASSEKGVEIVLNHNDSTCTRGCSVTVELHCQEKDLPIVQEIYSRIYSKNLQGLDFNPEQINSVYDPGQESATCPACGHEFSTKSSECPDCGLVLG